jgi:hypothetical protein
MFSPQPIAPDDAQHPWRYRLDQFAKEEQVTLGALAWAFYQQWPAKEQYLGLDLHPQPHFIACDPMVIAKLNDQVNGHIREMVGILNGYDPHTEVTIFVIGPSQFKLLFFPPTPDPAKCFENLGLGIEQLKEKLETILVELMN